MTGLAAGAGAAGFGAAAGWLVVGLAAGAGADVVGLLAGAGAAADGAGAASRVGRLGTTCDGPAGFPPVPTRTTFRDDR